MSSAYEQYVKSLNPSYYWTFERTVLEVTESYLGSQFWQYPAAPDPDPSSAWGIQDMHEEYQRYANRDSGVRATAPSTSHAYWYGQYYDDYNDSDGNYNHESRSPGPILGGTSMAIENWETTEDGPAFMHSGDDINSYTRTHLVPIGRDTDCTWNLWVRCFEVLTDGTRHYLTSSPLSGTEQQHLMFGENYDLGQRKIKVKTKHTQADDTVTNENIFIPYDWDATKWNMWTITMPETALGETITDGIQVFRNGRLAVSVDAVGDSMPTGGIQPTTTCPLMRVYGMRGYSSSPGGTTGAMSQVAAWDRVLNDSEISQIYYHAISPSPMRIRGGLHRQLGRLV